jgi:hypothetical protein
MSATITLIPKNGTFDTRAIKEYLDSNPSTLLDPCGTGTYLVGNLPGFIPIYFEKRRRDPSRFPYTTLVDVEPHEVVIYQEFGGAEAHRIAFDFLAWMWSSFDVLLKNYYQEDITERCRAEGLDWLYNPNVRATPSPPWKGYLVPVGFFKEMHHGEPHDFSLHDFVSPEPIPDEARLVQYLEAGYIFRKATEVAGDMLNLDDDRPIGLPHYLTDGTYVWPGDLPYYVRRYHVRLPPAFMIHARKLGFEVPGDVDVSKLALQE